jgi:hypothetical protein
LRYCRPSCWNTKSALSSLWKSRVQMREYARQAPERSSLEDWASGGSEQKQMTSRGSACEQESSASSCQGGRSEAILRNVILGAPIPIHPTRLVRGNSEGWNGSIQTEDGSFWFPASSEGWMTLIRGVKASRERVRVGERELKALREVCRGMPEMLGLDTKPYRDY